MGEKLSYLNRIRGFNLRVVGFTKSLREKDWVLQFARFMGHFSGNSPFCGTGFSGPGCPCKNGARVV